MNNINNLNGKEKIMIQNLVNNNGNFAVNQFVINGNNGVYFKSYDSMICLYKNGKLYVSPLWDYSNTTRKHFYIFLKKHTPFRYCTSKKDVLDMFKNGDFVEVNEASITPSIV